MITADQLRQLGYIQVGGEFFKKPSTAECVDAPASRALQPKPARSEHSAVAQPYEDRDSLPRPKPKRTVRNKSLGATPRKEAHPTCRKISIVSYRKRLIDPDNLCPKYFIDALRYEGIIDDDTAKHIILEVRQEQSDNPRTEITIE